ncbi:unnamed protein product [Prunus armeniaca]|uniref:Uncharacterized protein n=1 Tax=Prunus armeniaca TaxID=36596 RepID=A0A6J5XHP3_PRUAR|nr:unnamed protein product [Prunus armeniaca]CAB4312023.1 unnamed protein product [Prunus armeniaca]
MVKNNNNAHPGNRTLVSTVGGYYDTTTPDALLAIQSETIILNLTFESIYFPPRRSFTHSSRLVSLSLSLSIQVSNWQRGRQSPELDELIE